MAHSCSTQNHRILSDLQYDCFKLNSNHELGIKLYSLNDSSTSASKCFGLAVTNISFSYTNRDRLSVGRSLHGLEN